MGRAVRCALALALTLAGCSTRGPRSAEKLYEAYLDAIARNDAKAAYALLTPAVKAATPRAEFEARWAQQRAEHAAILESKPREPTIIHQGATVHAGGRVLTWAENPGDDPRAYYVTGGLPTEGRTDTPVEAIRTLLAGLRTADAEGLHEVLGEDLRAAFRDDWQARAEAIEAALEQPGALELSPDAQRAALRYAQGHMLTLERTDRGWRITALE